MPRPLLRCANSASVLTFKISNHPQELEEMLTGPHFVVEERFAQALSTAFICVIYSAGLPLLMPVAFVSFLLSYWVDKVRSPQPYRFYIQIAYQLAGFKTAY